MIRGLYAAYTGMINQQERLDTVTNNLANATTTGFKREGLTSKAFDQMLTVKIRDLSVPYINEGIGRMSLGVKIGENYTGYIYADDVYVDTIEIVDFEDYNYLSKYGENLYDLVEGGRERDTTAGVRQGYLEMSNINVVKEMVEMITISRAYESNQKLIQAADDMLDKSVNQVGRV